MKIVMTIAVRNEADIVEENLRYHLGAGVNFIIATDHRSEDGTTEILERYEARRPAPPDPRDRRGLPADRVGDADGQACGYELRRRLGDQRRYRRILVASQRHAARRVRGRAAQAMAPFAAPGVTSRFGPIRTKRSTSG